MTHPIKHLTVIVRVCALAVPTLFVLFLAIQPWWPAHLMFIDTVVAAERADDCCKAYFGSVSTLGIMLWAMTSAMCLLAVLMLINLNANSKLIYFALSGCVLNAILSIDDAFMLHESFLPGMGISQTLVIGVYGLSIILYLAVFREIFLRNDLWLLAFALVPLGMSVGVDEVFHSIEETMLVIEESPKFIGIFCWFVVHLQVLFSEISQQIRRRMGLETSAPVLWPIYSPAP